MGVSVQKAKEDSAAQVGPKPSLLRVVITLGALMFLGVHLGWPKIGIDNIAIALLVIALVPWLSSIFKSIEVTGLGKVEFLQKTVNQLTSTVADVKAQADAATQKSSFAAGATDAALSDLGKKQDYTAENILLFLAQQYVEVRKAMPSGWQRTDAVTTIFGEMVIAAARVERFNAKESLLSSDEGVRLAAIAFIYAKPDPQLLDDLVVSICEDEDKGFNQYWGLKAIQKIMQRTGEISGVSLNKLRELVEKIPAGTDRARELSRILGDVYPTMKRSPQG
jgi:hypothetical protein